MVSRMPNETVLIVDDDPSIRRLLTKIVSNSGFSSLTAANGSEAVRLARSSHPDLMLLDIMMNGNDEGFEVIRCLRATGNNTPIIVLSGRSEDFDALYGFGLGADDYIAKPFNSVTLGAKIQAMIRRSKSTSAASDFLTAGPFCYNNVTMEFSKNNNLISLSSREKVMMKLFLSNVGRVFTKEQLYELVWNNSVIDRNTIMVYVSRLRNKIEEDPQNPIYIQTVWGLGYKFSVKQS